MTTLATPLANGVSFYVNGANLPGLLPPGDNLITVPGADFTIMGQVQPTSSYWGFLTLNSQVWAAAKAGPNNVQIAALLASGNLIVVSP